MKWANTSHKNSGMLCVIHLQALTPCLRLRSGGDVTIDGAMHYVMRRLWHERVKSDSNSLVV